jgi:hypothetical protein
MVKWYIWIIGLYLCSACYLSCIDVGVQFGGPDGDGGVEDAAEGFDSHGEENVLLEETNQEVEIPDCPARPPIELSISADCIKEDCLGVHPSGQDGQYQSPRQALQLCRLNDASELGVYDPNSGLIWQSESTDRVKSDQFQSICQDDWRLPTAHELYSLVDFSRSGPLLDDDIFQIGIDYEFWSNTILQPDTSIVRVNFISPDFSAQTTTYAGVLCLQDYQLTTGKDPRYLESEPVSGQGVVTDHLTGLIWQAAAQDGLDWQAALTHCEDSTHASFEDWRVPNIQELVSLIEFGLYYPASQAPIDFEAEMLWSSTTPKIRQDLAHVVVIGTAQAYSTYKVEQHAVVCVRRVSEE